MYFYVGGFLILLMDIYCAVHAAKKGRAQWLYIILFFPLVGCIVYIITYMLPDMRVDSAVVSTGNKIAKKINPTRDLIRLKKQLEFSDTIANRQALANEYMSLGGYEDAVVLYESCLEGPYEDDPDMIVELANALYLNGNFEEAKEQLLKIKKNQPKSRAKDAFLLLARTYEQLDDINMALKEYESLKDVYPGEEARCRYALLLKRTGNPDLGNKIFNEIIFGASHSSRYYRKTQRKWIDFAKQQLNEYQQQNSSKEGEPT